MLYSTQPDQVMDSLTKRSPDKKFEGGEIEQAVRSETPAKLSKQRKSIHSQVNPQMKSRLKSIQRNSVYKDEERRI